MDWAELRWPTHPMEPLVPLRVHIAWTVAAENDRKSLVWISLKPLLLHRSQVGPHIAPSKPTTWSCWLSFLDKVLCGMYISRFSWRSVCCSRIWCNRWLQGHSSVWLHREIYRIFWHTNVWDRNFAIKTLPWDFVWVGRLIVDLRFLACMRCPCCFPSTSPYQWQPYLMNTTARVLCCAILSDLFVCVGI
jgi:hypothetical protein